jgi:hypothetical protein
VSGWINLRLKNNSNMPLVYVTHHSITGNQFQGLTIEGEGEITVTIQKKSQGNFKMKKNAMIAIIQSGSWIALYKPDPGLYNGEWVDLSTTEN